MSIEELYNPETQAYEFNYDALPELAKQKHQAWQAEQEQMWGRYKDLVDQSNAYRESMYGPYGNYEKLELGEPPDLSWTAYRQGRSWADNAVSRGLFNSTAFVRNKSGQFLNDVTNPRGGAKANDGTLYSLDVVNANSPYDRQWSASNPELSRQMRSDMAQASRDRMNANASQNSNTNRTTVIGGQDMPADVNNMGYNNVNDGSNVIDASVPQDIMDQYRQGGQRFETIPYGMDMYGRFNNPYGSGYYGTQGVNRNPMQDGVAGLPTTPNPMGKGGTSPLYQYMFANYQHDPNRVAPTAYLDQYGGAQAGETYLVGNQAIGQTYIPQQSMDQIQNFMGQMGKGGYQLPTLSNPYELDDGRYAQSIGGKGGMTSTDPSMGKGGMGKGG